MKPTLDFQFYDLKDYVYLLTFDYVVRTKRTFSGLRSLILTKKDVYNYIRKNGVLINSKKVISPVHKVKNGDEIKFPKEGILFICRKKTSNNNEGENKPLPPIVPKVEIPEKIDDYVNNFLTVHLGSSNLKQIPLDKSKLMFATIVALFKEKGFDLIKEYEFSYQLTDFLKEKLSTTNIAKELKIQKSQLSFAGKLVQILTQAKAEIESDLITVTENLVNGNYDKSPFRFLQDYNKIITTETFQYVIQPFLNVNISSRIAIENLIRPVNKSITTQSIEDRYILYDEGKQIFVNYFHLVSSSNSYLKEVYHNISEYLFKQFKINCDMTVERLAELSIASTGRKYNFANSERKNQEIFLVISNGGQGLAKNVSASSLNENFLFKSVEIGLLKPNERRELIIKSLVNYTENFSPEFTINLKWENLSGEISNKECIVKFELQEKSVPWKELEKSKPYTIQEIEDKEKLYGRDVILDELKSNILSDKIESYKIWGQKRVGKSSIVKTLRSLFSEHEKIIIVWRSIAGLKNTNPELTLNTLGESLSGEIFEEIDRKIKDSIERDRLKSIPVPEFNGSLFPLENYIKKLKRLDNGLRFVFILDEFDRINEDFFLPGKLGDTLSINIGKGLNENNFVGFILVGSENMHLLDRQGMNYNSYQEREIDTFNKETEFDSFKKIITGPVYPHLIYSDEAIDRIYSVTNGNPYFANLICQFVFKICSTLKDSEVDVHIVNKAIETIVNSSQKSHFEHFWGDGITEETNIKKERKADIRRRVLVSYSFAYFSNKQYPNRTEIIKTFKKPLEYIIENYEIENTITEFFNRKIFYEDPNSRIGIRPSLFQAWLCGPGRTLMIEGVSDLEALQREKQLEEEYTIKPDEIKRLSDLLIFQGHKIDLVDFKSYFNQFGGPLEQRRVFKLVDSLYYLSKEEISEFFKKEQKNIFKRSEIEVRQGAKIPYREGIELYSFPKTVSENSEIVETLKVHSHIRSTKTLKDINIAKDSWKQNNSEDIIIFESVIDDFNAIQKYLLDLFDERLKRENIPVKLVVLLITTKAKADLIKAMSSLPNFRLIHCREIEESKIRPFIDTSEVFETREEAGYVYAEVRKHFSQTGKDTLNVLLESHCPGKSLPILWCKTNQFKPLFHNPNWEIPLQDKGNEELRDRVYYANKELIQTINPFLIGHVKRKAQKDGKEDWFHVDYIPKAILEKIMAKWIEEGQINPRESYFDLIHYKEIIKKNREILHLFERKEGGGDGLNWMDKLNETRRDPAHPEKPPPVLMETEYFEVVKEDILSRIRSYSPGISSCTII